MMQKKSMIIIVLFLILLSTIAYAEYVTVPGKKINFSVNEKAKTVYSSGGGGGGSSYVSSTGCNSTPICGGWGECINGTYIKLCTSECAGNYTVLGNCTINTKPKKTTPKLTIPPANQTIKPTEMLSIPKEKTPPKTEETKINYWWLAIPLSILIILIILGIRYLKKVFDREGVDEFGFKEIKTEEPKTENDDFDEQIKKELQDLN